MTTVSTGPFRRIINVHWRRPMCDYVAFAIELRGDVPGFSSPAYAGDPPLSEIELIPHPGFDAYDSGYANSFGFTYDEQLGVRIKGAMCHVPDVGWNTIDVADIAVSGLPPPGTGAITYGDWETNVVLDDIDFTDATPFVIDGQTYDQAPSATVRGSGFNLDGSPKWIKDATSGVINVKFAAQEISAATPSVPVDFTGVSVMHEERTYNAVALQLLHPFGPGNTLARQWLLCALPSS